MANMLPVEGVSSIWKKIKDQRKRLLKAAPGGIEKDLQKATEAPSTMRRLRKQLKKTAGQLQETAPQLTIAGGGLFMTLNNWGLVPESDVLPLEQFNRVWQPDEPDRCTLIRAMLTVMLLAARRHSGFASQAAL